MHRRPLLFVAFVTALLLSACCGGMAMDMVELATLSATLGEEHGGSFGVSLKDDRIVITITGSPVGELAEAERATRAKGIALEIVRSMSEPEDYSELTIRFTTQEGDTAPELARYEYSMAKLLAKP